MGRTDGEHDTGGYDVVEEVEGPTAEVDLEDNGTVPGSVWPERNALPGLARLLLYSECPVGDNLPLAVLGEGVPRERVFPVVSLDYFQVQLGEVIDP